MSLAPPLAPFSDPDPLLDPQSEPERPPSPSVPPRDINAAAVQEYLFTHFSYQGYGLKYSRWLASLLDGVDGEGLYKLSQDELMDIYGELVGRNLFWKIEKEKLGLVGSPIWVWLYGMADDDGDSLAEK
ncbi:MAG: hypothetical protein Q9221_000756 [Calogaya cf. arnoldii]